MNNLQQNQVPPSTYYLVTSAPDESDSLDLFGFLASCWERRRIFIAAMLVSMILSLFWTFSGEPRIEYSTVLASPTSGRGESGSNPLVTAASMTTTFEAVVSPVVLARQAAGSESDQNFRALGVQVTATALPSSGMVEITASAPASRSPAASEFLEMASREMMGVLQPAFERHLILLDGRMADLTLQLESTRSTLQSEELSSHPIDVLLISRDVATLESELAAVQRERSLSLPAAEVRGVIELPREGLLPWRLKRVLVALLGAGFIAVMVTLAAVVVSGVQQRLRETNATT